jgi:hypothetical protein
MPAHTRLLLAAWAAALVLLTLPQIAAANPGTGPGLVQRSGKFVILHADGRSGRSFRQPMLANGLHETPVRAPAGVWIDPGSQVRLEGTMQAGTFVLADSLTAVRQLAPSPNAALATSAAPSIETTAVVMFYFANQTAGALPSVSTADAMMNTGPSSLKAYYLEQTYGQVAFQGDVLPPVQLAEPAPVDVDCSTAIFTWSQLAFGQMPSFDPSLYRHIVFVFPAVAACGWSGFADVGGSNVWINGALSVRALAHELGHNLGLGHAGGLSCTASGAPAPVGDSCSIDRQDYRSAGVLPQYGDPFDAMGNATVLRQMNMEHKLALGVLPDTAVQTIVAPGTYRLAPMETLGPSVELLVLPKPGGGNYFLEYRQPVGVFDLQAGPSAAGVLVHTESPDLADPLSAVYADSDTALVDMHPDGAFAPGQWQDAAMSVGQVFSDAANGITIKELAADASGASLAISLSIDTQPPSSPAALTAVASGTAVALTWTAASDDVGIDSYRVERDGAAIGTPAETTFTDTDTGLAPGATVNYAVTAVDTSGNIGPAATVAVTVPDNEAPGAPVYVMAAVTRDGRVHIAWGPSTDNVGVTSYHVLRAGVVIGRTKSRAYVDSTPRAGTAAAVTYSVIALDAAGNASPPSAAEPLRAALLRKLRALRLTVSRPKAGKLVRVQGTLSDPQALCRVRLDRGAWRGCKIAAGGAFRANLRGRAARRVTVYLRDELGRVKLQTLPIP